MSHNTKQRYLVNRDLHRREQMLIRAEIDEETTERELKEATIMMRPNDNHPIYPFMRKGFCQFTPTIDMSLTNFLQFHKPTPIQSFVIPYMLESERSLQISAKPGAGKTLAYLLPILDAVCRMKKAEEFMDNIRIQQAAPYAIIVLSDNFLVKEVASLVEFLLGQATIKVSLGLKGENSLREENSLRAKGCDLYIGVIGKVTNSIQQENTLNPPILSTRRLKFLVLDDLSKKHLRGIGELLKSKIWQQNSECRVVNVSSDLYMSNVMTEDESDIDFVERFSMFDCRTSGERMMLMTSEELDYVLPNDSIRLVIESLWSLPHIRQEFHITGELQKTERLFEVVAQQLETTDDEKILIFIDDHSRGGKLKISLMKRFESKLERFAILDKKPPSYESKSNILDNFRKGITSVLIVAEEDMKMLRGLNLPNVKTVINYNFPKGADDYVRKIGRCGRGYTSGHSITFFDPSQDRKDKIWEIVQACEKSGQSGATRELQVYM